MIMEFLSLETITQLQVTTLGLMSQVHKPFLMSWVYTSLLVQEIA